MGSGSSSSPLPFLAGGNLQEQPKRNKAVDFSSLFSFSDLVHSVFWICFTADRSPSVIFFFSSVPCAARQGGTDEGVVSLLEAVSWVCWPVGCCCLRFCWRLASWPLVQKERAEGRFPVSVGGGVVLAARESEGQWRGTAGWLWVTKQGPAGFLEEQGLGWRLCWWPGDGPCGWGSSFFFFPKERRGLRLQCWKNREKIGPAALFLRCGQGRWFSFFQGRGRSASTRERGETKWPKGEVAAEGGSGFLFQRERGRRPLVRFPERGRVASCPLFVWGSLRFAFPKPKEWGAVCWFQRVAAAMVFL